MTRKNLAALLMSMALVALFALPALAQTATEAATPPVTVPSSTSQSTAEATASPTATTPASTETSTAEVTASATATTVTVTPTTTPTTTATAQSTAASTAAATAASTAPAVPANAILSHLNSPRGISYDAQGDLFVAEAGSAGPTLVEHDPTNGDTYAGITSKITEFSAAATESAPVPFLISGGSEGEIVGATDVISTGSSIWVEIGSQIPGNPYSDSVAEVDVASGGIKNFISPAVYEATNNPDGTDINSNINSITLGSDGTLYIIDAGGNTVYSWTQANGLKVFHVWKDDPVPTALAFASDGSFYVSFLGQGIAPNAGHVEHWSADGQTLIETYGNLTAVTDVAVGKDGSVYAVELVTGFGAQGPTLNSGAVVKLANGTSTVIAPNLPQPYSIAQAPDGSWAVSVNSSFSAPDSGAVIKLS